MMSGKRSNRNKIHNFPCPSCQCRLWRSGNAKHHLFYTGASEIKQNLQISSKKAGMISRQGAYVDPGKWIEEFFCPEHGKMWLLVSKNTNDCLMAQPATESDWQRSTGTLRPELSNPTVSEYTQRMSRRADIRFRGEK
jgi:predicted RNA-binding Zn-ribbon protein involved in translation (DUF1610 family)